MSDLYVTLDDLNAKNIKDFIGAAWAADAGYSYADYGDALWEMSGGAVIRYSDVYFSQAKKTGGSEGSGEYMDVVWKVHDDNGAERYFKETGRYYSFVGGEWNDDMHEVFPKQVEVTVYE